ncbi:MAG: bifunctional phosphoribosylaminoimidazolecarboxamide formyltransferase/IMP cyclohydrolase [Anaerovoracaceae bacterium]|jgi:phosphoribosylaminoimidazolecarboxamide formyltransferase/IMP cyclohydrolase
MRALLSVSDKTGIVEFAKELEKLGVEIISTGGTHKKLEEAGVKVTGISEVTGFPECLDGRVKTLHPAVHAGLLARRDHPDHMQQLKDLGIEPIDIVAINLYPFKATILKPEVTLEDAIENIDIGGPTMLRSSAKNHKDVTVVCDPADYDMVIEALKNGGTTYDQRYKLALKVFQTTAAYDAMISDYLRKQAGLDLPDNPTFTFEKKQDLRYGENPHQKATYYSEIKPWDGSLVKAEQLHGKELSFNNINDTNGALETLKEFTDKPAVVAVKHANPCGVAVADKLADAYRKAHDCDPVSIFGGIVACNRTIDKETAEEMNKIFLEIVIAPDFDDDALAILTQKKNIRLLKLPDILKPAPADAIDFKKISGGLLVQGLDTELFDVENAPKPDQPASDKAEAGKSAFGKLVADGKLMVVTDKEPTEAELADMEMAMKVVKHTKSNGIVFVKDQMTIAIGPGQTNRIWAAENGIKRCLFDMKGAVMASDAFFPFNDCVEAAADAGITAIIQPGGSIRDQESIDMANEKGVSMVFSGMRHFKH